MPANGFGWWLVDCWSIDSLPEFERYGPRQLGPFRQDEFAVDIDEARPLRGYRHRSEVVEALAKFIVTGMGRLGGALLIPPLTFAQLLIATSDAIVLSSELDDVDLYRPIVEMYTSAIKLP